MAHAHPIHGDRIDTVLHASAFLGRLRVIEHLVVKYGMDIEMRSSAANTALDLAVRDMPSREMNSTSKACVLKWKT